MSLKSTTHTTSNVEAAPDDSHQNDARERGAESSGEIKGGGHWKVFDTAEGHVVVVTLGPGARSKRRLPKTLSTLEDRAKFARMAAPDIKAKILDDAKKKTEEDAAKPDPKKLTFRDVSDMWTNGTLARLHPDHVQEKASVEDDRSRLKVLNEIIGDVPIDAPDWVDHAQRAMSKLPERCRTSGTRRQYSGLIRRVLQLGVWPLRLRSDQPLPRNFQPKAGKAKATQWIRPLEDAKLISSSAVPLERRIFWGVLAREGMRDGEAVLLAFKDLDLNTGVLTLDRNKSRNPRAWVMDASVTRALKQWKKIRFPEGEPPPKALVFVDTNGATFKGTRFADQFRADLKAAGVDRHELFVKSEARSPIRAHDLRASFATCAMSMGKSEAWCMDRGGWTTSAMLNRYRRTARTAAELALGWFQPLDVLLFGDPEHEPDGGDGGPKNDCSESAASEASVPDPVPEDDCSGDDEVEGSQESHDHARLSSISRSGGTVDAADSKKGQASQRETIRRESPQTPRHEEARGTSRPLVLVPREGGTSSEQAFGDTIRCTDELRRSVLSVLGMLDVDVMDIEGARAELRRLLRSVR